MKTCSRLERRGGINWNVPNPDPPPPRSVEEVHQDGPVATIVVNDLRLSVTVAHKARVSFDVYIIVRVVQEGRKLLRVNTMPLTLCKLLDGFCRDVFSTRPAET